MKNIKLNDLTVVLLFICLLSGYINRAVAIMFLVMFHELGHVFIILLLGYKIKEIEIYPFGGITRVDKLINDKMINDILISLGGIFFQFIIFLLCKFHIINDPFIYNMNNIIMIFNMLPIIPLDGSKLFLEGLCYFYSFRKSYNIYIWSSIIFLIFFLLFNIYYRLDNYLIIGFLLFKIIEFSKMKDVYFQKFIIEKILYCIDYSYVDNNVFPHDYYKDTKYYYYYDNRVLDDREYLSKYGNYGTYDH